MLDTGTAFSSFSVYDIQKAKQFYRDILGFEVTENQEGLLELHLKSGGRVLIYPKANHMPASFTVLNFTVSDIEKTVADLKGKGVPFESYDNGSMKTDPDDILRAGKPFIAWFTDPAGNILSLIEA